MTPKPTLRAQRMWTMIGAQIRQARELSGLNPTAFALTIRISRQALHQFETGQRGARLETLYRIAAASGQSISFLLPPVEDVLTNSPSSGL